jgi:stalled ribosome rescue protein Dom34
MSAGRDGGAGVGRRDELADRLDAVAEELSDLALDSLRAALERGDTSRPADEKRLTQARRAVEKAAHLLRTADGPTAGGQADDGTAEG